MKEERLIGNSGIQELRQQCFDLLEEIRQSSGVLNDFFSVSENQEHFLVFLDEDKKVIMGLRRDGVVYIPNLYNPKINKDIQDLRESLDENINREDQEINNIKNNLLYLNEYFHNTVNPEWIKVTIDSDGRIIEGFSKDGTKVINVSTVINGILSCDKINLKDISFESFDDIEGRSEIVTDNEGKVLSYRKKDGTKVEKAGFEADHFKSPDVNIGGGQALLDSLNLTPPGMTAFQQALKDAGFNPGGSGDWTEYLTNDGDNPLLLSEPYCAICNITSDNGVATWPQTKTVDAQYYIEFYDMLGNYFKKKCIMNAQGQSTMGLPKKNATLDLFDEDWGGDAFAVRFGDWVPQDSFHLKAYYGDFFRGISVVAYKLAEQVAKTRGPMKDTSWKKGIFANYNFAPYILDGDQPDGLEVQMDNGAKCMPGAFPCIIYMNGEFYGVYAWSLKKHRDNYAMKKSNAKHIHLDGKISRASFFNGVIDWTQFEIRNPKGLYCINTREVSGFAYQDITGTEEAATAYSTGNYTECTAKPTDFTNDYIIETYGENPPAYLYRTSKSKMYKLVTLSGYEYLEYDGDNPCEIIDSTMPYYNPNNKGHVLTNEVKGYIVAFSNRCHEIEQAYESSMEDGDALLAEYFDVENLIDYICIQCAMADHDAIVNNGQWTTWDGKRWFDNNYDKDGCFGALYMSTFFYRNLLGDAIYESAKSNPPFHLIWKNHKADLKSRWLECVNKGLFTTSNIANLINSWMRRIGKCNLALEYKKWNESPCNRDDGVDHEHWLYVGNYTDGISPYDSETVYNNGDECYIDGGNVPYTVRCISEEPIQGINPVVHTYSLFPHYFGVRDSIGRVTASIEDSLERVMNKINNL